MDINYKDLIKLYPDGCPNGEPKFQVNEEVTFSDMAFSSRLVVGSPTYYPNTDFPIYFFDEHGVSPIINEQQNRIYKIPYSNIKLIRLLE